MNTIHMVFAIALSVFFIFVLVRKVLHKNLLEKYAILWLYVSFFALSSPLLYALCIYLHEKWHFPVPTTTMMSMAMFLLCIICLYLTIEISASVRQRKKLAQRIALLEYKIKAIEMKNMDKANE